MTINLYAAWIGLLLGCLAGVIPGMFFYRNDWLGGYASWERRMIRLGHISFFGIGSLNLAFALTSRSLQFDTGLQAISLLLLGAASMPMVCYLAAWKAVFRHLFFIPATCATVGISLFVWRLLAT